MGDPRHISPTAMIQHDLFDSPSRTRRLPPLCDASRIKGLEAQVEDLKYTLSNLLQHVAESPSLPQEGRCAALIEDARAALRARLVDYLG